jgi:tetratricopeptide (TPR) repeat protein
MAKAVPAGAGAARLVGAALVLLFGGAAVASTGYAAVNRGGAPNRALAVAPWDARAHSRRAEQAMADGQLSGPVVATAKADAMAALRRDPTLVASWRTLGLLAAARGDATGAGRLFAVAERRSRRDLLTQIWLIEDRVQHGDIVRALRHYDIALRTNPSGHDVLMPILVAAAGQPAVAPALGRLLQSRPPWTGNYYYRLSQAIPDASVMAGMLEVARRGGPLANAETIAGMLPVLVERRDYAAALRIAGVLSGSAVQLPKGVWNGDFTAESGYPPLDWAVTQADGFGAEFRGTAAGGRALVAFAASENSGTVARQVLMLAPGTYRLTVRVARTDLPPATLRWRVACAQAAEVPLVDAASDPARARAGAWTFLVPVNCPAQWLSVDATSSDPGGSETAIERVAVAAAS